MYTKLYYKIIAKWQASAFFYISKPRPHPLLNVSDAVTLFYGIIFAIRTQSQNGLWSIEVAIFIVFYISNFEFLLGRQKHFIDCVYLHFAHRTFMICNGRFMLFVPFDILMSILFVIPDCTCLRVGALYDDISNFSRKSKQDWLLKL